MKLHFKNYQIICSTAISTPCPFCLAFSFCLVLRYLAVMWRTCGQRKVLNTKRPVENVTMTMITVLICQALTRYQVCHHVRSVLYSIKYPQRSAGVVPYHGLQGIQSLSLTSRPDRCSPSTHSSAGHSLYLSGRCHLAAGLLSYSPCQKCCLAPVFHITGPFVAFQFLLSVTSLGSSPPALIILSHLVVNFHHSIRHQKVSVHVLVSLCGTCMPSL